MNPTAQRHQAAERSRLIRAERAQVKAALRHRSLTLTEVLAEPAVATMRISDLLECIPGLSPRKVSCVLLTLGIGYWRPVESMTVHEIAEIKRVIRRRHRYVRVES